MTILRCVNENFLPIKLHYFFFFGALGSVTPFLSVIAKNLGINATAAGLIFLTLNFSGFLSSIFFGYLSDYLRNIKVILQLLISLTAVSYLCISFIPRIDESHIEIFTTRLTCNNNSQTITFPMENNKFCFNTFLSQNVTFELEYKNSSVNVTGTCSNIKFESHNLTYSSSTECIYDIKQSEFYLQSNSNQTLECNSTGVKYTVHETKPSITSCYKQDNSNIFVYHTYQYWTYFLLVVLAESGESATVSLSDVACYKALGDKRELYGRQRLWGTISHGMTTLFTGLLNDLITGTSMRKSYASGFYIMLILIFLDLFSVHKIRTKKSDVDHVATNIFKSVALVFTSYELIAFSIAVFLAGAFAGLILNYEFWYLEDLGATQTLFGLTQASQCLLGEIPMFFFSGWFIKTFGHFCCMICVLFAYSARFGLYFLLKNPWLVLPVELLHGITFSVYYATMIGYASSRAPPGTQATMVGIFSGLYDGLGLATGSFLSGVAYERLGGRQTFLIAASISLLSGLILLAFRISTRLKSNKNNHSVNYSDVPQN